MAVLNAETMLRSKLATTRWLQVATGNSFPVVQVASGTRDRQVTTGSRDLQVTTGPRDCRISWLQELVTTASQSLSHKCQRQIVIHAWNIWLQFMRVTILDPYLPSSLLYHMHVCAPVCMKQARESALITRETRISATVKQVLLC